ncbi:MAG: hypothetical protein ACRETN_09155 [Nevskiales bacterium]
MNTAIRVLGSGLLMLMLAGCPPLPPVGAPVSVTVDNSSVTTQPQVNRLVVGTNTQWIHSGDGLLLPNSLSFAPQVLARATDLAPTMVRYPGGTLTDAYRWQTGIGPLASRGQSINAFSGIPATVFFGTVEMLNLSRILGAEPLISVNTVTGTASEAADWVRFVNIDQPATGAGLPIARFWEIGNEPYLRNENQPQFTRTPAEYLVALNSFVPAMQAVDPSIQVGLPLVSPNVERFLTPPYDTYNATVLNGRTVPLGYVAVHNAYLPFTFTPGAPANNQLNVAFSAAATASMRDLDALKLRMLASGLDVPFAITEYSPLVTLGRSSDNLINSPAGALYIADLLTLYAARDDILSANHWSLVGNGFFGAIGFNATMRPAFTMLRELSRDLRGARLPIAVATPTFDAPEFGVVPATNGVPLVSGFACTDAGRVRVVLINRDVTASHPTTLNFASAVNGGGEKRTYAAHGTALMAFSSGGGGAPTFVAEAVGALQGTPLSLSLAPQSVTVIDLAL